MTRSAGSSGLARCGSAPMAASASRMAARSTTHGTPVKSWSSTRAGMKLISLELAPSPRATNATSSVETRRPSSCRSRFSSRILVEKGRRATWPTPVSSRRERRKHSYCAFPTRSLAAAPKLFFDISLIIVAGASSSQSGACPGTLVRGKWIGIHRPEVRCASTVYGGHGGGCDVVGLRRSWQGAGRGAAQASGECRHRQDGQSGARGEYHCVGDPEQAQLFRHQPGRTDPSERTGRLDPSVADEESRFHGVAALDLSRVLAPKMVTMNTDSSPAVFLAP